MRWDALFDDLEAQLAAADAAELAGEVADRTRHEVAQLALVDRMRGARGRTVTVRVVGGDSVTGRLAAVGPGWAVLHEGEREVLVVLDALRTLTGLGPWTAPAGADGVVAARLGLGSALRGLARDRARVGVLLRDGARVAGTLERVGADFVELRADVDEPGGRDGADPVTTLPWAALALLRRAG